MKLVSTLIVKLAMFAVLLSLDSGQQSLDPSISAAGKPREGLVFSTRKSARVTYDTNGRKLSIGWIWQPIANPNGVYKMTEHSTEYRPTAIKAVGPNRLCVAGIYDSGRVVIEELTFGSPQTHTIGAPGGGISYIIDEGTIDVSGLYYDVSPENSEGPVAFMLYDHGSGAQGGLIVGLFNTGNIYSIAASGAMGLAVGGSSFPPPSPIHGFSQFLEIDHPTKGFLYVLRETAGRTFVLRDALRNGVLGAPDEILGNEWTNKGYEGGVALNETPEFGIGLTIGG